MPTFTNTSEMRQTRYQSLVKAREMLDKIELEKRAIKPEERVQLDELQKDAKDLEIKIADRERENEEWRSAEMEAIDQRSGLARLKFTKPQSGKELRFRDEHGNEIRCLRHGESYRSALNIPDSNLSLGKLIHATITGDWSNAKEERASYAEGTNATGGYLLNPQMSANIIDLARANMVVTAAGAQTVPMTTEVLKLATVTADPTAYWVHEGQEITESEGTFGALELRARALAVYCEASLALWRDATNGPQLIEQTIAKAIALALDAAALNGSGAGEQPLGMLHCSQVQNYPVGGVFDYGKLVEAKRRCWRYNIEPSAMIMNHGLRAYTAALYDGDGVPIAGRIPEFDTLNKQWTTALSSTANTCCYVGDFSNVLIGIRNSVEVEASTVAGTVFQRAKVAIRGYLRGDIGFARANDIVKMSGITGCTST